MFFSGQRVQIQRRGVKMDFQKFADGFVTMTGIMSVRKFSDGSYGDIRIVTENKEYIRLIENPPYDVGGRAIEKFVPNSAYEKYLPKNLSFEDLCYSAAILKKPTHTYVYMNEPNLWFNVFVMPIDYEEGDVGYCTYSTKIADVTDLDLMSTQAMHIYSDVIKTCIKLHGTDDFEQTMKDVIKDIRVICKAEVCSLMLVDTGTGTCSMLATNIREGSVIKRVTQFVNFYDIALSWIDTIGDNDCLIIKNEQDMKYIEQINNPWYLTLEEAGVDSVVMFPLRYNNEVLGFIWATNFATENALRIKETLELTTYFLSSEVASYKLMKQLEHISYTDLLTGVKNRNAMNSRVSAMTADSESFSEPYCVIFADLNGLKLTNDRHGHSAGDLLLKKAAIALQEVFEGDEIYRAGGDEFLIIMVGCDKDECERKIALLKDRSQDPDGVSFAVGYSYGDNGCDVRDAMHTADVDMYRDKEEFYKKHPERKLR